MAPRLNQPTSHTYAGNGFLEDSILLSGEAAKIMCFDWTRVGFQLVELEGSDAAAVGGAGVRSPPLFNNINFRTLLQETATICVDVCGDNGSVCLTEKINDK